MRVAIDLMGGISSSVSLFNIIKDHYKNTKDIHFIFIASDIDISTTSNFSFIKSKTTIHMEENPLFAIRKKTDSSICIGIDLLKKKKADCFISAGNTGALVAYSKMQIPIKNIKPALLVLVPGEKKLAILDVGANISCSSQTLKEFAILGALFQKARNIKTPKVGILNIGEEPKKGTIEIKNAYSEIGNLANSSKLFKFLGNIEGNEVFQKDIDVLVTDGFTGNIFLKTAEGITNLIFDRLFSCGDEYKHFQPHIIDLFNSLHYSKYPGALLLGLNSIVVKAHGYSSPIAFLNAVKGAIAYTNQNFLYTIKKFYKPDI